jgi:hypothetical protein
MRRIAEAAVAEWLMLSRFAAGIDSGLDVALTFTFGFRLPVGTILQLGETNDEEKAQGHSSGISQASLRWANRTLR